MYTTHRASAQGLGSVLIILGVVAATLKNAWILPLAIIVAYGIFTKKEWVPTYAQISGMLFIIITIILFIKTIRYSTGVGWSDTIIMALATAALLLIAQNEGGSTDYEEKGIPLPLWTAPIIFALITGYELIRIFGISIVHFGAAEVGLYLTGMAPSILCGIAAIGILFRQTWAGPMFLSGILIIPSMLLV